MYQRRLDEDETRDCTMYFLTVSSFISLALGAYFYVHVLHPILFHSDNFHTYQA